MLLRNKKFIALVALGAVLSMGVACTKSDDNKNRGAVVAAPADKKDADSKDVVADQQEVAKVETVEGLSKAIADNTTNIDSMYEQVEVLTRNIRLAQNRIDLEAVKPTPKFSKQVIERNTEIIASAQAERSTLIKQIQVTLLKNKIAKVKLDTLKTQNFLASNSDLSEDNKTPHIKKIATNNESLKNLASELVALEKEELPSAEGANEFYEKFMDQADASGLVGKSILLDSPTEKNLAAHLSSLSMEDISKENQDLAYEKIIIKGQIKVLSSKMPELVKEIRKSKAITTSNGQGMHITSQMVNQSKYRQLIRDVAAGQKKIKTIDSNLEELQLYKLAKNHMVTISDFQTSIEKMSSAANFTPPMSMSLEVGMTKEQVALRGVISKIVKQFGK